MKKSLFLSIFLLCFLGFFSFAKAETYTYTATNLQTTRCPLGAEFDRFGMAWRPGDTVKIVGTGFGATGDKIYLPTNEGVYWMDMDSGQSTTNPGYLGVISWNNNEVNLEIRQGLGNFLGSYTILRPANSDGSNCIRGTLTTGLICTSFAYSDWSACQPNGTKTRIITNSSPNGCSGGDQVLTQSCSYIPACTTNDYSCGDWNSCSIGGNQTRTCNKTSNCDGGVQMPEISQSCTYTPPICSSWTYSDWSSCSSSGSQTRSLTSSSPNSCIGGSPVLSQSCTYVPPTPACTISDWSCSGWETCSQSGNQIKTCNKISNCQGGVSSPVTSQSCAYVAPVPSCTYFNYSNWSECSSNGKQTRNITSKYPYNCESGELSKTTQSCTYTPSCTADTWTCGAWGSCSLSGVQNRSCKKTFDCSSVETAPPTTDQYCDAPSRPVQQVPQDSGEISNQDTIIKATVKLYCLYKNETGVQGSGTVIDSSGTILTNKHVVDQTLGCLVEFVDNFNDTPNYDIRQIADIQKISSNEDVAILKLRNPQNRKLTYIDITKANNNFRLGTKVNIYGYPAIFGTNMTYTDGIFSGIDGSYLKTTAILEHGNSGGGAYLSNGMFIGIPSSVRKGELNALGYILSISTINSWLGNSSLTYNNSSNNYSRVSSILETIDLKKLESLRQVIPGTKESKEIINKTTQNSSAVPSSIIEKSAPTQIQKENPRVNSDTPKISKPVIASSTEQKVIDDSTPVRVADNQQQEKQVINSWPRRFFRWLVSFF
jgi:S1-C subfamily serine protease